MSHDGASLHHAGIVYPRGDAGAENLRLPGFDRRYGAGRPGGSTCLDELGGEAARREPRAIRHAECLAEMVRGRGPNGDEAGGEDAEAGRLEFLFR